MSDPGRHERKRASIAAALPGKTGRTLEQWAEIARTAPVDGFQATVVWLKQQHGLTHFQARRVVEEARAPTQSRGGR